MIGSFYSGVSGLHSHQLWLDIVGENLANINTPGFKRSRPIFEDILNHNYKPPEKPRDGTGGVNPMQIGNGVTLAAAQVIHEQGTDLITNKSTDLSIIGEGSFFILSDGISPSYRYTRAGAFDFDPEGNLVNQNGLKVMGWNAKRDPITQQLLKDAEDKTIIDITEPLESIKVIQGDIMPGRATTKVALESGLKSDQNIAIDPVKLNFVKSVKSVVAVSKGQKGIDVTAAWADAGFNKTPDGTISINGAKFKIGGEGGYGTPEALMNAINMSAAAGVTITYEDDKFTIIPDKPGTQLELVEDPITPGHGFFTQAMIKAGTPDEPYIYNTSFDAEIQFEHLFDPYHPDKNYYRWRAVDPKTTELITTNAYHYERGDVLQGEGAMDPGAVIGEELKLEGITIVDEITGLTSTIWYANLANPDVDPTTLRVYITDPTTNSTILATQGKWRNPDPMGMATTIYYFDDNGEDPRFGKSKNGVDRIVFSTSLLTPTLSAPQAIITCDYRRNGFNMHTSTVDPANLMVKINGAVVPSALYKFNNNQGVGGNDQITFYSAASSDEVVADTLDITKPFASAGFNWNAPIGDSELWSTSTLSSYIHFRWTGGSWTSGPLSSYNSIQDFMSLVKSGTNGNITIEYDPKTDRFTLYNKVAVSAYQSTSTGFFSLAKLKGEGTWNNETNPPTIEGSSWIFFEAGENPTSREKVVSDRLDTRLSFRKAGFNNAGPTGSSVLTFSWIAINPDTGVPETFVWTSLTMSTFGSIDSFINHINDAVEEISGTSRPLPVILRYNPVQDRFTLVNTNHPEYYVRVQQSDPNGFLTKARLLTSGLGSVEIPHSIVKSGDVVTADYYYNKTVEAKGVLELDENGKVVDNFIDTEAAPVVISSAKIMGPGKTINMTGGWSQFERGTVDGTITITTKSGSYTSRFINSANYPTVQSLFQEINTSDAKVTITYHPDIDKVSISTKEEGDEIILEETGLIPLFSTFNITTGKIVGGNNNSVIDLETERPIPEDGWKETTGLHGTGKDYFRVNIMPNETKNEKIGEGGKGLQGTQVVDEMHLSEEFAEGQSSIYLWNADVDPSTITVYDVGNGYIIPRGEPFMPNEVYWEFSDNTGPGGRDEIKFYNWTGPTDIYVSYTRLNAFDLPHPDVDKTTLIVRVDGRILGEDEYEFLDDQGTNGLDRILIQPHTGPENPGTIGAGVITVDYRLTTPEAVDFFIPNGNEGPEDITFTPNSITSGMTSYDRGGKVYLADSGDPVTAILKDKKEYEWKIAENFYDAFGNPHKSNFVFEKLSENKWLWKVMNPIETDKVAGYGLLKFKGDGTFDYENSEIFGSPSDPSPHGAKFKGIYFDAPVMPTPPESGGAPPPGKGADTTKIAADFSKMVQYTRNDVKVKENDGYPMGKLIEDKTRIDSQGRVIAYYDNGQTQDIAQIALSRFANPSGLEKIDGTLFGETVNSGKPIIGKPGYEGRGVLKPRHLEGSNVDLVKEFADMIIAQRAFQANGRTVITADQIFTEIIGIKRP
jgi:flagellar hook-basal body protein